MNAKTIILDEPRKAKSLAMQLVEKMTLQIRAGQLKVGQKLPTEAEIMHNFGVSRTVVREAISRLQASMLVETRHGIGTFVLPQDTAPSFSISAHQLGTLREVIALLEFRISIETEAAALASQRRNPENLAELQNAMLAFRLALEEGRDAVQADFLFHQEIARATQNKHFQELMHSLGTGAIPRGRLENPLPVTPERLAYLRRVNEEHESIFNAIAAQDPEAARAAMRTHLSNSRDRLKKSESTAQASRKGT
jgi:GntR family transcriptional repressor for pyruvate dehydrogenase complex